MSRSAWLRLAVVLAGVALAVWLGVLLRSVLTPFAVAFALAYFLNPGVNALERFLDKDIARSRLFRGRLQPRVAAVGLLVAVVLLLAAAVLAVVVPLLVEQVTDAVAKLPGYLRTVRARVEPVYERLNLRYPEQMDEVRQQVEEAMRRYLPQLLAPIPRLVRAAFSSVMSFVLTLLNLLMIPVLTVYLLYDMNRIRAGAKELVPHRYRDYVYSRAAQVDRLLSAFARGQITVCLMLGAFYAVGLSICGVPLGLLVGTLIGFLNLVPYMSGALGLPLALGLSWVDDGQPVRLLAVAGVLAFGQLVESNFITPRIVGERLGLHVVVTLLAVLVGGTLFGFVGMLVAVPVTAVLAVFWADLRDLYLRSGFYRGAAGA